MFLTLTVNDGSEEAVRDLLTGMSGFTRSVAFREPDEHLLCVVGIGSHLWDRLFPNLPKPRGLHPFEEIKGDKHTAVSTPGDLLIHLRSGRLDMCFELARLLGKKFEGHAEIIDEVHGFKFFEMRDLLGFVDGTENPDGPDAVVAAQIDSDETDYAGASYVHVQHYTHDMAAWNALSVTEQELVIGRTKLEDTELDDSVKPANSHVAVNTLTDADGDPAAR